MPTQYHFELFLNSLELNMGSVVFLWSTVGIFQQRTYKVVLRLVTDSHIFLSPFFPPSLSLYTDLLPHPHLLQRLTFSLPITDKQTIWKPLRNGSPCHHSSLTTQTMKKYMKKKKEKGTSQTPSLHHQMKQNSGQFLGLVVFQIITSSIFPHQIK